MYGMSIFGQAPVKNQAFKVYFRAYKKSITPPSSIDTPSNLVCTVIKDSSAVAIATNTPVAVTNSTGEFYAGGWYSLVLTAEEMNADNVVVGLLDKGGVVMANAVHIVTTTAIGGTDSKVVPFSVIIFAMNAVSQGYEISNCDFQDATYNYYGLVKRRKDWMIIRETKESLEYSYYKNPNTTTSYDDDWADRQNLVYVSTPPIL